MLARQQRRRSQQRREGAELRFEMEEASLTNEGVPKQRLADAHQTLMESKISFQKPLSNVSHAVSIFLPALHMLVKGDRANSRGLNCVRGLQQSWRRGVGRVSRRRGMDIEWHTFEPDHSLRIISIAGPDST